MDTNQNQKIIPPVSCPNCQRSVAEFKGVSQKTGRPYQFFGCVNPDCRWIWRKPSQTELKIDALGQLVKAIYIKVKKIEQAVSGQPVDVSEIPDEEIPIVE